MPEGPVVVNTSPLIALDALGLVGLLRRYGEVLVPPAVALELDAGGPGFPGAGVLSRERFLRVEAPRSPAPTDLGPGEGEAIALALERAASRIVLDDRAARAAARIRGLRVTGTVGILVGARRRGEIPSLAEVLSLLAKKGFRLDGGVVEAALRAGGERPPR